MVLRCYRQVTDLSTAAVAQRNRSICREYEADNVVMSITNEEGGSWSVIWPTVGARNHFMGAFDEQTGDFVFAMGPVSWICRVPWLLRGRDRGADT
jgi:hypothetical protein